MKYILITKITNKYDKTDMLSLFLFPFIHYFVSYKPIYYAIENYVNRGMQTKKD